MKYLVPLAAVLIFVLGGYLFVRSNPTTTPTLPDQGTPTQVGISTSRSIDLSGQGLTKVPSYIFDRTDLEALDLSGNALTGALPSEVGRLQNLRLLDLSNNHFTGVPAEVGHLKKLEVLILANNSLTGLPYELADLQSLKILDLSGNQYSEADLAVIRAGLPPTAAIKTQ